MVETEISGRLSLNKFLSPIARGFTISDPIRDIPSEKIGQNIHPPESCSLSLIINTGLVQVHFGHFWHCSVVNSLIVSGARPRDKVT